MERSGIVAISGQPNVGKSTIINGFLQEKVSIISKKPETTRNIIRGIYTEKDLQIIFIDTPGIHKPHNLLGKIMLREAESVIMEADLILFITEKTHAFNKDDENIFSRLPNPKDNKRCIFVINKVDKIQDKKTLLPLIEKASSMYPFDEIVPICALKQSDLDRLLGIIKTYIPEGPFLYPEEQLTDKSNAFMIQELIREKILELTHEEIPHSTAIIIDKMEESENHVVKIYAVIYVERLSQKSIIIGKKGNMIKEIGRLARQDIEQLLSKHVYLNLWVKVYEKWKTSPDALKEMGYTG